MKQPVTHHRKLLDRRDVLKRCALAGAGLFAAPMLNLGRGRIFANSTVEYSSRAIDLVRQSVVIDMLAPITLDFAKQNGWFRDPESFTASDLQPYKDAGINVLHTAVGLGGPDAYDRVLRLFASWNGFIANHDQHGFREKIDIEGLNHPKRMYDLTEGLIRRKYSDAAIQGILGGNFKRVLSSIWTT